MTIIQANIYKNGDSSKPLNGYIRVTARSIIADGANLYVSDPVIYPLVNGSARIDLVATTTSRVSHNFAVLEYAALGDEEEGDRLLYTLDAVVPDSLVPINLNSLAQQSGLRYDQQDASLLTLATFILRSDLVQNRLLDKLLNVRGVYDPLLVYRKGDGVLYDGNGFIYTSDLATAGNYPPDGAYWRQYVSKGDTGSATLGDNSPYSPAWAGSTTTPSRNALYNYLELLMTKTDAAATYAPLNNPTLRRPTQDTSYPLPPTDNSSRLADTAWVQALTLPHAAQIAVGGRYKWDNSLAIPAKTLRADGSAVSRSLYSQLYTVYGSTYGAGDGTSTFSLPLDPGFLIYTGV